MTVGQQHPYAAPKARRRRLDPGPRLERLYVPDEAAALQALRVVLGLPKRPLAFREAEK